MQRLFSTETAPPRVGTKQKHRTCTQQYGRGRVHHLKSVHQHGNAHPEARPLQVQEDVWLQRLMGLQYMQQLTREINLGLRASPPAPHQLQVSHGLQYCTEVPPFCSHRLQQLNFEL